MLRDELEQYLNTLLCIEDFQDYCPNGLQIEGSAEINKLVTGVTASQALIDKAIEEEADAILVHHGYFWKGEDPRLRHMKKKRIGSLMAHGISLFAYHLPLDAHPDFGNNAQLASLLGVEVLHALEKHGRHDLGLVCRLPRAVLAKDYAQQLTNLLGRQVQMLGPETRQLETIALCTGAAQSMFEAAVLNHQVDAYLSGEVSEPCFHIAEEYQRCYFALGHHASERYGAKALGEHVAEQFSLSVNFIDLVNPV